MREDNLLAIQPRAFLVTTDSDHELEVYLNVAKRMKLSGINQLWIADITYILLKAEFVYLAVILDAYSRKVGGWTLEQTLAARLPLTALEPANRGTPAHRWACCTTPRFAPAPYSPMLLSGLAT